MQNIEVTYKGHYGNDLEHVNAARVSFGRESEWDFSCAVCNNNQDDCWLHDDVCGMDGKPTIGKKVLKEKDKRLLQFLARGMTADDFEEFVWQIDDKSSIAEFKRTELIDLLWQWRDIAEHRSPFNHSFISLHVRAPIFVARQLVKHEYMPWNEMSGRYIEFNEDAFYKHNEFRSKVRDKKQGSGEPIEGDAKNVLECIFDMNAKQSFFDYKKALENGLCEEQARSLLPLNLMTEWRWSGTFGAWAKMLRHRLASDAQKETQKVAQLCAEIIKPLFPVSYESLVERKF